MLKHYLDRQEDALESMLSRHHELQSSAETERQRLQALQEYQSSVCTGAGEFNAMALQNVSAMQQVLNQLSREQQGRFQGAVAEAERQRQACLNQKRFTCGLTQLVERRERRQRAEQQRREQQHQDELAMQQVSRRSI